MNKVAQSSAELPQTVNSPFHKMTMENHNILETTSEFFSETDSMTNVIKFRKRFYQNAKLSGTYGFFPTRQPYKRFRSAAIAFLRVSRQRWWIQFGRERLVPTTSALRRRSASFRGLSARKHTHEANIDMLNGMNSLERWQNAVVLILQKRITNRLWSFSASEVTTLSRYTIVFIIIIIIFSPPAQSL